MKKSDLELLGLSENATEEEIKDAYTKLRAKYLEDRFKDGEEGNEAARMLTKLDTAYAEIMSELSESQNVKNGGTSFEKVEELIRSGDIQEAQRVLDSFNERSGRWHYLQSVVFYKKSWMNESKKQLEIAIQMDGSNAKYRDAYEKLKSRTEYKQQTGGAVHTDPDPTPAEDQMGGNWCANCASCCYTYLCVNCLFNLCCGCR